MPDDYERARDDREIANLRERARRARYVIHHISDKQAADGLKRHAEELEARADALAAKYTLPEAATVPSGEPPIAEAMAALKTEAAPEPEPPDEKPEPEPAK